MLVISTKKAQPGMKIGRNIYRSSGEILLAIGVELTPKYIDRLEELGIPILYIQDESMSKIEIDDVISEKTSTKLMTYLLSY